MSNIASFPCILHISDPQFGMFFSTAKFEGINTITVLANSIVRSLKNFSRTNKISVNILVITGDIASTGIYGDYEECREFLNIICRDLKIKKENIVLIPGNHDLDRKIALSDDQNKFKAYIAFCDDFFKDIENYEKGVCSSIKILDDYGIAFCCFNTAEGIKIEDKNGELKPIDGTDHGNINEKQLNDIQDKMKELPNSLLKVALFHHNPSPIEKNYSFLHSWDAIRNYLLKNNVQLGLCGHIHDNSYTFQGSDIKDLFHIICAGSLSAKASEMRDFTPYSLNIINFTQKNIMEIFCFQYNTLNKDWEKVKQYDQTQISVQNLETGGKLQNPFRLTSAESMETNFSDFFVEEVDHLEILESDMSCFIFGRRGSGKSMNLHYMKIENLLKRKSETCEILNKKNTISYIALLFQLKNNLFSDIQFDHFLIKIHLREDLLLEICESYMILIIFDALVNTFLNNFGEVLKKITNLIEISPRFTFQNELFNNNLDIKSTQRSTNLYSYLLDFSEHLQKLRQEQRNFFHSCYETDECNISKFTKFYYEDLKTFIRILKIYFSENDFKLFLMFDDAESLHKIQQTIINNWIAQRATTLISFKIALKSMQLWHFLTSKGTISENDDYRILNMDELYTTALKPYYKKISKICEKRLKNFSYTITIEEMFPENIDMINLFNSVTEQFKKKYKERIAYEKKYRRKVKEMIVSQYYRDIGKKHLSPDYSGFRNIVHLSSGNNRNFLELCFKIFNHAQKLGVLNKRGYKILPKTQMEAIKQHCASKFEGINRKIQSLSEQNIPGKPSQKELKELKNRYSELKNFIQNLSLEFKKRLKNDKNPAIKFSFQYSGQESRHLEIIKLGNDEDFFQQYFYASKEHQRPFPTYSLHRAIVAHFGLYIRSHSGTLIINNRLFSEIISRKKLDEFLGKMIKSEGKEGIVIEYKDIEDFDEFGLMKKV